MYKINVLLVTYNQQDVISRAIDSVLKQKKYGLNKLVILDDCSPDDNWRVICKYASEYPQIIKPYRNEENIGIYRNMQKLVGLRGEADLFVFLAGDDAYCDGFFNAVQNFLETQNVDLSIPIGIYCDWKYVFTNGKERIKSHEAIGKGLSPFSLYIRGEAGGRGMLVNDEVLAQYDSLILGHGLNLTESAFDSQKARYIHKAYYLPYIGVKYYSGIGVSTQLTLGKSDYHTTQAISKWQYFIDNYIQEEPDIWYAKYCIEMANYYIHPSIGSFFRTLLFYHKGRLNGLNYSINDYLSIMKKMLKYTIK